MLEKEIEDARKGNGGRFGAGEDHRSARGENLGVGHEFWVVVGGLSEFGEEVDAARVGLTFGEAVGFNLLDLAGAFVGAGLGELGDGEDGVAEADALGEESDWVLFEDEVENGHLANLKDISIKDRI